MDIIFFFTFNVGFVLRAAPIALHASTPHVLPLRVNVFISTASPIALTTSTATERFHLLVWHVENLICYHLPLC